ncbi:MAG TPA: hypothetical protein VGC34_09840, partial [Steroidobacteraceae bacterium]
SRYRRAVLLLGALLALPAFIAPGQSTPSTNTTSQVTPGHAATITPSKIVPTPPSTPQDKIIDHALDSETRQKLLDAMNSTNATSASTPAAK